jgi:nickel-dependent lactate racemase
MGIGLKNTKEYMIAYDKEQKKIQVPAENVKTEITFTDFPALPKLEKAFFEALENPVGCEPLSKRLKPGYKIAMPVGSRVTDWMLGVRDNLGVKLLDYLNTLGIKDQDVTVLYAAGMHAMHNIEERFGPELLSRVNLILHDPRDESNLKYCGVTSRATPVWVNRAVVDADFVLGFGEISPTTQGGWCGGGKIILPGVAGKDTIEANHAFTMAPLNTWGRANTNPMRLDMEEAADLAGLDMKMDILINSREEVVAIYAGDFREEHRTALIKAREIWMTKMDPVDIAIVHPNKARERYLSRSFFGMLDSSDLATKDDGTIILVLSGTGGWAPPEEIPGESCGPELLKMPMEQLAQKIVRKEGYVRGMAMLFSAKKILNNKRVIVVSNGISDQDAKEFGFAYSTRSFEDALSQALKQHGDDASISIKFNEGVAWRCCPWVED